MRGPWDAGTGENLPIGQRRGRDTGGAQGLQAEATGDHPPVTVDKQTASIRQLMYDGNELFFTMTGTMSLSGYALRIGQAQHDFTGAYDVRHGSYTWYRDAADQRGYNRGQQVEVAIEPLDTPDNTPASGDVAIVGGTAPSDVEPRTVQVGDGLNASVSAVHDVNGMATSIWTHEWLRADCEWRCEFQSVGTRSSYTVSAVDVGKILMLRSTFTDDLGYRETKSRRTLPVLGSPQSAPSDGASLTARLYVGTVDNGAGYEALGYDLTDFAYAFHVTNGKVTRVQRVDNPHNDNDGAKPRWCRPQSPEGSRLRSSQTRSGYGPPRSGCRASWALRRT